MAFSRKHGSNLLKEVWNTFNMEVSKGAFRKFAHKPSMANLSPQVASPLNTKTHFPRRGTSRRNNQEERTCWGGGGETGLTHPGRSFTSFVRARRQHLHSLKIERRNNVVGEPLPSTHLLAPYNRASGRVGRLQEGVSECNCHHDCE